MVALTTMGEVIDGALVPQPAIKEHFRTLPYQDVGAALATVESSGAILPAKLCLRFVVLTAARTGEARGAVWDEVDLDSGAWRISASRMKAGVEHRVPLSDQALEVLSRAAAFSDDSGWVSVTDEAG